MAASVYVVCFEYAAGPYTTREIAEREMAHFDCPHIHEIVTSATKPVTRYAAIRAAQDAQLAAQED